MSENPDELCDRLNIIIQQKQGGDDSNRFDDEIVARIDELLGKKRIIKIQRKNISINFELI